jgi:hypothetical protein
LYQYTEQTDSVPEQAFDKVHWDALKSASTNIVFSQRLGEIGEKFFS